MDAINNRNMVGITPLYWHASSKHDWLFKFTCTCIFSCKIAKKIYTILVLLYNYINLKLGDINRLNE